jgi:hypothetical protein
MDPAGARPSKCIIIIINGVFGAREDAIGVEAAG